jgi:hypothetical protein
MVRKTDDKGYMLPVFANTPDFCPVRFVV